MTEHKHFALIKSVISNMICKAINVSQNGKIDERLLNSYSNEGSDNIIKIIVEKQTRKKTCDNCGNYSYCVPLKFNRKTGKIE